MKRRDARDGLEYEALEIGTVEAIAFSISFALTESEKDGTITHEAKEKIAKRCDALLAAIMSGKVIKASPDGTYEIINREDVIDDSPDNLIIGG